MKPISALLLTTLLMAFGAEVTAQEARAAATGKAGDDVPGRTAAKNTAAPAAQLAADPARGKRLSFTCYTCHYVGKNLPHHTGPNLYGMFGRKAGTAPGYAYSEAIKKSGITWTPEELDRWLADPKGYLPGSKMVFIGVPNAQDRRDIIAYLQSLMNGGQQ